MAALQRPHVISCPHGYEGQGPEHSSARLERFLALCANDNMQVVYPTTPAQMFHVLRRQMNRSFRKPLVMMTPKSLLRSPRRGQRSRRPRQRRLPARPRRPHAVTDPSKIRRPARPVQRQGLLRPRRCTARRSAASDVAMVRLEQLYPFRARERRAGAGSGTRATESVAWVQEEPKNMGAFRHVDAILREQCDLEVAYVGREPNSSPAVASMKMHQQQQERIMINAMGLPGRRGRPGARARRAHACPLTSPFRARASRSPRSSSAPGRSRIRRLGREGRVARRDRVGQGHGSRSRPSESGLLTIAGGRRAPSCPWAP